MVKFRIGVDFDNTIACYDNVFTNVAYEMGLILESAFLTKDEVKRIIHLGNLGDNNWQKLQGQVYGRFMYLASVFPGFTEFLKLAKLKGHEVFIVSHKSLYGHFDEKKIPLRDEAMRWLIENKFVGNDLLMIPKENVFFEATRQEKINRIKSISFTHFIDDLQEVFDEESFPDSVSKYLFDPASKGKAKSYQFEGSWRSISKKILGDWDLKNLLAVTKNLYSGLDIESIDLVRGRGNSKIYKLIGSKESYALKIYPDRQTDQRNRLETEFSACQMLSMEGMPVVKGIFCNSEMNWGIYSWIDGYNETPDDEFVSKAISFVKNLIELSAKADKYEFQEASEACLSGFEIVRQLNERLDRLKNIDNALLQYFLTNELIPTMEIAIKLASDEMEESFNQIIPTEDQILSPSDFGSHNAIRTNHGETVFIDFEYFGWDDPVKLASDFYLHPAMNLSLQLKNKWIKKIMAIFLSNDNTFNKRFKAYLPLFGIRWCLILLNEFLPNRIEQRIHADIEKADQILNIQELQVQKSRKLLNNLKLTLNHG